MTKTIKLIILISTCFPIYSFNQITGDSYLFEGNNFEIQVLANGQLVGQGDDGIFHLKGSDVQMAKSAGLWLLGLTPAQTVSGAIQSNASEGQSDFQSGSLEGFGVNQFWVVTKDDIENHRADFFDNFNVDEPIPAIFSWPGKGNPHFESYTGYALPNNLSAYAPFWDRNVDGIYDPLDGDHPVENMTICDYQRPDRLTWLMFNDQKEHSISGTIYPKGLEIALTLISFGCENDQALNNTLFLNYQVSNNYPESTDSTFVGFYIDGDIGCPDDDYVGTIPELESIYFYNADEEDDYCSPFVTIEDNIPPSVSVTQIQGPIDEYGNLLELSKTMPFYNFPTAPPGMQSPNLSSSLDFYRSISGSWRDGTPLTEGGQGYQDGSTNTNFAYPDLPTNSSGWSELTANNPLGDRAMLMSAGPFRFDPGKQFTLRYAISIFDDPNSNSLDEQISFMNEKVDLVKQILNCGVPNTFDLVECTPTSLLDIAINSDFSLYPNPSTGNLLIQGHFEQFTSYKIFNTQAQVLKQDIISGQNLNVSSLTAGIYFIQFTNQKEQQITKRIIIQK